MPKILMEYHQDDVDPCELQMDKEVSEGEAIVVLAHAIGMVTGNEDLEADILRVILDRSLNNG